MLLENNPFPQDGRVRREAACLVAAGYRVRIIAPRDAGQAWRETVAGAEVYRYPAPPAAGGLLGYLWEYGYSLAAAVLLSAWVFVRHGIDAIHGHNPPDTAALVAALYKPFGVRYVFDHHDLAPEMYDARFAAHSRRLVRRALLALERLSFRVADHVIATNESYKAIAVARGGLTPARVTVVRNGPDPRRVHPVPPDPALRARGVTILGYVGQMGPQDGVDYLLRALHRLRLDLGRDDFYCLVIGPGDALPGLLGLARELGLDQHVRFTGWVSDADLRRCLSSADICVDPDPSNPFTDRSTMVKMAEYMAMAKPIVAFDLPEHRVTAGEAAVYARPNDELEFARCLARLMDDPERRRRMGRLGRQRVTCRLAWCHQEPHLLAAYAALFPGLQGQARTRRRLAAL